MTTTLTRRSSAARAVNTRTADTSANPRRNGSRVAIGLLLVVLCMLGVVALYSSANDRIVVLSIRHEVAVGQEIRADDLTTVSVSVNADVPTVDAAARPTVVGKTAAVTLMPGSLLMRSQVSDGPRIAQGMVIAGAILKPGQYPVGLRAGDEVVLVETPSSTATGAAATPIERGTARVLETEQIKDSASTLAVSLVVPTAMGAPVASAGAAGRLTMVVAAPR